MGVLQCMDQYRSRAGYLIDLIKQRLKPTSRSITSTTCQRSREDPKPRHSLPKNQEIEPEIFAPTPPLIHAITKHHKFSPVRHLPQGVTLD